LQSLLSEKLQLPFALFSFFCRKWHFELKMLHVALLKGPVNGQTERNFAGFGSHRQQSNHAFQEAASKSRPSKAPGYMKL
jgi:hypothetical protein